MRETLVKALSGLRLFGRSSEPRRPDTLNFVSQRLYRLRQLLQAKFQSRLHGAEWSGSSGRDLAVTEAVEKCKLEGFALIAGQTSHPLFQKVPQIAVHKRHFRIFPRTTWLPRYLFPVAIARSTISLSPPQ